MGKSTPADRNSIGDFCGCQPRVGGDPVWYHLGSESTSVEVQIQKLLDGEAMRGVIADDIRDAVHPVEEDLLVILVARELEALELGRQVLVLAGGVVQLHVLTGPRHIHSRVALYAPPLVEFSRHETGSVSGPEVAGKDVEECVLSAVEHWQLLRWPDLPLRVTPSPGVCRSVLPQRGSQVLEVSCEEVVDQQAGLKGN